jgi:HD-like signal output (HDOD) protein
MFEWLQRLFSDNSDNTAQKTATPEPPAATPPKPAPVASAPAAAPAGTKAATSTTAAASPASPATVKPAAKPAAAKAGEAYGATWEQRNDANANFNDWLFELNSDSELSTTAVEDEILEALAGIIASKQSGANLVKRMPGLVPQLLQNLRSENFSGAELSKKIAHDPVLVAAVIRIANSSANSLSKTITSIEHAVLILGQQGLRQLITGVAFRPIIDMNSGRFTKHVAPKIWQQSERCALVCRLLAEPRGLEPFEAFLAGLIQQVGLVVCLRIMDQHAASAKEPIGSPAFCSALLKQARVLSGSIGREWNFPEVVSKAIEEQGSVFNTAQMSPMGKVLSLADYISKLRMLVDANRLTEGDTRIFKGLPPEALSSYEALAEFVDYDPLTDGK